MTPLAETAASFDVIAADTGEVIEVRHGAPARVGEWLRTGLLLPDATTHSEWRSVGDTLQQMERSVMWWIGDWLRFGDRKWGETYKAAADATGYDEGTLRDAKWVADAFDLSDRSDNLAWTHYRTAASLPPAERAEVLALAERDGLSVREIKAEISRRRVTVGEQPSDGTCTVQDLHGLVVRGRKFGAIYADPPWLYDNQGTRAATSNHYGGMTVDELCELPVRDLAAEDAHLHLWTTNAFLFECPRIFGAWGFEFRSSFVWVKPQMGIGNYWRNSHEILLTAIRGDAKRFNDKSLMSWIECARGAHSAKPEIVRDYIRRASPGPYLEMFGRLQVPGWTVWGNQVRADLLSGQVEVLP
jgi:N6-adenosine-specific RNA methylase IME4